ncbi:MAG TPA: GvpL/GvpF family gas vesicle protein [Gemmatimonadaceae bacterium]|nr:GvpL/GvpF family gas vesicle protein [Gemmatimonadaceae bacterium]
MAATTADSLWYVYGVVPTTLASSASPAGLDDAGVHVETDGPVAALVSVLDAASYAPERVEAASGDVEWLSPRAVAHDMVLTWASDQGPVIPMPMFSMFSSRDAVHAMLRERAPRLADTLARIGRGREYALRVYRIDGELLGAIATMSPRLRELADSAATASPGQRYLLERKIEAEKKTEVRAVTQQVVDEIVGALAAHALESARSPIPRLADADAAARGAMVLNAAFLVAPAALAEFQRTLTDFVERYDGKGFRFDFTGPWPAYHFAGEAAHAG